MKSIFALTVLIFTCFLGHAQSNTENISLAKETIKVKTIQNVESNTSKTLTIKNETNIKVARLYKNKNNRVFKALTFTIKTNKPKMA